MTDKIKEKVSRFLELSFKFSKLESDLFDTSKYTIDYITDLSNTGCSVTAFPERAQLSRTERIKRANRELETLSEE